MAAILFVRIKSNLDDKELEKRMLERKPKFLEIPGLAQKFYGYDAANDAWCGVYIFESKEALANFGASELAQTIPSAYEAVEVRREVYDLLYPLRPENGPLKNW